MARNNHGYTEEELDLLTDEELAGLEDDSVIDEGARVYGADDEEEDEADIEARAATTEEDAKVTAETADDDESSDDEEPEQPAAKAAADPDPNADPAASVEPQESVQREAQVLPRYDVPTDAKDKIKNLDAQLDDLARQFDEGELTATEYRAKSAPLEGEKMDLRELLFKQEISLDSQIARWTSHTVPSFLDAHPEYEKGSVLFKTLDAEVKRLQEESDNPFNPTFLETAHRNIQTSIRKSMGLPPLDAEQKVDPATKKRREIPPSLATLPSADISDADDGGEFAYLDRLATKDPLKYEEAIAKLPADKLDAYLQS